MAGSRLTVPAIPGARRAPVGSWAMPLLPRDPDHDIDAELRRLITREESRMILEAAPVAGDWDDPEV